MLSSSEYVQIINRYEQARMNVVALQRMFGELDCSSATKYLSSCNIGGESIDGGGLSLTNVLNDLNSISSDFYKIIEECNNKIDMYKELYRKARALENSQVETND